MTRIALRCALLACLGCAGGETPTRQVTSGIGADAGSPDGPVAVDCAGEADAVPCGAGKHCVTGQCRDNRCGDAVRAGDEECDDGNLATADGCTPSCRLVPETCGDGLVQRGEECDDGNWFDLDGCSDACTTNECGNGREDPGEACDDGNTTDTDECSNRCTENRCRNGRLDPGEECDDGNPIHDDGCSNACVVVVCGNGRIEDASRGGDEECDDGNDVDDDACSGACTRNQCGNLRIDPGELCDGDSSELDCSDDCRSVTQSSGCAECRTQNCRAYDPFEAGAGLDLVAGCTDHGDATFRAECVAVLDCARRTGCGYAGSFESWTSVNDCFCGSTDANRCQMEGAADGPCKAEWLAAARTGSLAEFVSRMPDAVTPYPSGMGYWLLACDLQRCREECGPRP